ncbi:hypothetical protein FQN60_007903, partial [Etheostoma spectabile]
ALSSLHPECEYIFQLEKEERSLPSVHCRAEQQNHRMVVSHSGMQCLLASCRSWGNSPNSLSCHLLPLQKQHSSVSRNCTSGGWSRHFPPYHACSVDDDIPETEQLYFATVKLIYTVGYSISLVVLAVAVFILLLSGGCVVPGTSFTFSSSSHLS